MLTVSRRHIRIACLAVVGLLLTTMALMLAEREGGLGAIAHDASNWRYAGMVIPFVPLHMIGLFHLGLWLCGLVGVFMFRNWGRRLLVAALLLGLLIVPFAGEVVLGPWTMLTANLLGVAHIWLIAVCYWSPASDFFRGGAGPAPGSSQWEA